MISEIFRSVSNIIFPKFCVGCKEPGSLLCQKCALQVQYVYDQNCPICQHPSIGGLTHPRCRTNWGIDGLTSIAYYRGPVRPLIRQLKYAGATVTSELIEQLISKYQSFETINLPPAIITAIPLDKQTFKDRGFNQSEYIALALSSQLGYPYIPDLLQRQRKNISQTKLTKAERRQNMQGVFKVADNLSTVDLLKKTSIIIADDVFTTGATLSEAAKVFKRLGVAKVYGFTLAQD